MEAALGLAELYARPPRILVIDDEPIIHHAFKKLAERICLTVESKTDPELGIEAAISSDYDLIFLDMKFESDVNGMVVLHRLSTLNCAAHIVIMSGSVNLHEIMAEANNFGVVSFLLKPVAFTADFLTGILRRLHIKLIPRDQED